LIRLSANSWSDGKERYMQSLFRRGRVVLWLLALTSLAIAPSPAVAAPIAIVPAGLNSGDTFHLIFLTDGGRDATSFDINDYNAFVQAEADAVGLNLINGQPISWYAIASTTAVDARDNIGNVAAPIFRLDGAPVALNEADMFNGLVPDSSVNLTPTGNVLDTVAWTGSNRSGVEASDMIYGNAGLGGTTSSAAVGLTKNVDGNARWLLQSFAPRTAVERFYAISGPITVVPEPTAIVLLLSAVSALVFRRASR
jgi:hypothetical protein